MSQLQPLVTLSDNVGLANDTVKIAKTKAIDMRKPYFW